MSAREPSEERSVLRRMLARVMRVFSDVRPGEGLTALSLLAAVFVLFVAYYVLKTVREPLVLASASQDLQFLRDAGVPSSIVDALLHQSGPERKALASGMQAVLLIGFLPAYAWLATKIDRSRLITSVSLFFIACIEFFFVLRLAQAPMLGFFFFIWVGIFSNSMVSQFWSFANDVYTEDQGKRLFPVVGIGATAGGPLGAKVAGFLYSYLSPDPSAPRGSLDAFQRFVVDRELDPAFVLLQVPVLLLLVFLALMIFAARRLDASATATATAKTHDAKGHAPGDVVERSRGLTAIVRSRYLLSIAAVIAILNLVNTLGELLLSDLAVEAADAAVRAGSTPSADAWIADFYGDYFFYVNIAALVLQAFVLSRLVARFGLAGVLFALPCVALGSYTLFALGLGIAVLRWAKTAENATDYSIMNTGKAMVWLPTTRAAKYGGKQAVDTFVVRLADAAAALLFLVGSASFGLGTRAFAAINAVLVVAWLGLTALLLRRYKRIEADPSSDPASTPSVARPSAAAM